MFAKVEENPSQSVNQIYEEVRSSFAQKLAPENKQLFLQHFPPFRNIAPHLYHKRREKIPADPKTMKDFKCWTFSLHVRSGADCLYCRRDSTRREEGLTVWLQVPSQTACFSSATSD